MTDYDLRTKQALRRVVLLEYGFGPETLQQRNVFLFFCRANRAQDTHGTDCGAALPEKTLYDLYRARHRCCLNCGVVVTDVAVYCPECGTRLPKAARRRGAAG